MFIIRVNDCLFILFAMFEVKNYCVCKHLCTHDERQKGWVAIYVYNLPVENMTLLLHLFWLLTQNGFI